MKKLLLFTIMSSYTLLSMCMEKKEIPSLKHMCIHFLRQNPYLINKKDSRGRTPLYKAVRDNNETLSRFLISLKAKVNSANEKGNTPLHVAQDTEIIEQLRTAGANIHHRNNEGKTPLLFHLDVCMNVPTFEKTLIKYGANPNDTIPTSGMSALHIACLRKKKYAMKHLLKYGADPSLLSKTGQLPIECIGMCDNQDQLHSFLQLFEPYGYKVFPQSPLIDQDLYLLLKDNAVHLKQLENEYRITNATEELLRNLFSFLPDETQPLGMIKKSTLGLVCRYPSYELLENFFGPTTVAYAKEVFKAQAVGSYFVYILQKYGSQEVNKKIQKPVPLLDLDGPFRITPPTPAENEKYYQAALKAFLFKFVSCASIQKSFHEDDRICIPGLDKDSKNNEGKTALSYAITNDVQNAGLIKQLLEWGVNPNVKDNDGTYPLEHIISAVSYHEKLQKKIVSLLLQHGAIVRKRFLENIHNHSVLSLLSKAHDKQMCAVCWQHSDDLNSLPCSKRHAELMCTSCFKSKKFEGLARSVCPVCQSPFNPDLIGNFFDTQKG